MLKTKTWLVIIGSERGKAKDDELRVGALTAADAKILVESFLKKGRVIKSIKRIARTEVKK